MSPGGIGCLGRFGTRMVRNCWVIAPGKPGTRAEHAMDVQPSSAGRDLLSREPPLGGDQPINAVPKPEFSGSPAGEAGPVRSEPPEPSSQPAQDLRQAEVENLDRLSKVLMAVIPALVAALAVVGGATGGLARMFRDDSVAARSAVGLIFLSFALAACTRRSPTVGRSGAGTVDRLAGTRAGLLMVSGVVLVAGIAWAFETQIAVMGNGQAPVVTGTLTPTPTGDSLDGHVEATGVKSTSRIVVFAFESSDGNGDSRSRKVPLYYSRTGPDPNGRVDVHVVAQVPASDLHAYPYLFVTAVLGEEQRDCDGALIEGHGPAAPAQTACLTLARPGGPAPGASQSPAALSTPTAVAVPGTVSWTSTALRLVRGQRFVVRASGLVSFSPTAPPVGPDGATDSHPGVCVLPGADHHAALIGLIRGQTAGQPFLVGRDLEAVAAQSGELDLGINDTGLDNNGGSFQASVELASQGPYSCSPSPGAAVTVPGL